MTACLQPAGGRPRTVTGAMHAQSRRRRSRAVTRTVSPHRRAPTPSTQDLIELVELGFNDQEAVALIFQRAWWRARVAAERRGTASGPRSRTP